MLVVYRLKKNISVHNTDIIVYNTNIIVHNTIHNCTQYNTVRRGAEHLKHLSH